MVNINFTVDVVFALSNKQTLLTVNLVDGATVEDAIIKSGILAAYSEIDLAKNKVGIWGRTCKLNNQVVAGDRVEIYRDLIADPREVRRPKRD